MRNVTLFSLRLLSGVGKDGRVDGCTSRPQEPEWPEVITQITSFKTEYFMNVKPLL